MARIKYAAGVDPIFGQIEGFVFQSNSYGQTMKSKPKMRTWKSTVQKLRNAYFTTANNNWKNMTIGSRTAWNNFANVRPQPTRHDATKFLNGYNLFVQRNYYKFLAEYQNFTFMDVPVFTSPLNDTFTAVAQLNAGVLTLVFTFTRADSTLQCLMNVSKTNYPSLHYIGSGTRYLGSILNANQSVDITDQYLSFYGQLPAEGDFIYVGLTQNSLVGGQTYFSAPVLVKVESNLPPVKNGYLYPWDIQNQASPLCAAPWRFPSLADHTAIRSRIAANFWNYDSSSVLWTSSVNKQGKAVAIQSTFAFSAVVGAIGNTDFPLINNISGIGLKASGSRNQFGFFTGFGSLGQILTTYPYDATRFYTFRTANSNTSWYRFRIDKKEGCSVRFCRDAIGTPDGTIGTYTGNDGRIYATIVYNNIEIMTENLAETLYLDLSAIPTVTNNAIWAAGGGNMKCAYGNDESNV